MAFAARIHQHGGADEFKYEAFEPGSPGAGQVLIEHHAIGLNFIDIYHRSGLYQLADFPAIVGMEAAGTIRAIGDGVDGFAVGGRVAYACPPVGAYCTERVMAVDNLIKMPDNIDDDTAAAMMLQGLTVQYLIRQTYRVQTGNTVLLHAAAGGIGLIACQWLKHLGVTVIGTVGSEEKAALAKAHGCDHTIQYRSENIAERVREITSGQGVPVVYDSIGPATLEASLDSLQPRGLLVSFGNASGPVENFNFGTLAAKGSLFVTRPTLMTYTAERANLQAMADDLLNVVGSGAVKININQRFPLKDAGKAQAALENRETTGSTILVP